MSNFIANQTLVMKKLADKIGPKGLDEGVCCVCDEIAKCSMLKTHLVNNETELLYSMSCCQLRNPEPDKLYPDLVLYYECSKYHPSLAGLMLSPRGINYTLKDGIGSNEEEDVTFDVCALL